MKFKYQKKHQPLDPIKQGLRLFAHALGKAFLYLGTPALCPLHQTCSLSQLHCQYLGVCPFCRPCTLSGSRTLETCSNRYYSCCGSFIDSYAPCKSSMKSRKWNGPSATRNGKSDSKGIKTQIT
ncbi:uncharacterized protein LOC6497742 isoform X3 [Drosophila ananassae]|uniref:uncharacterized protein LOC6497742 isoform X3 n=1 Tax=Drosophila ananassae TaxID=7217 RepID=UPI0013A5DDF0|nr:uncharacterized protein LOC6497742 isoform X3 [Drosophila ananassae]